MNKKPYYKFDGKSGKVWRVSEKMPKLEGQPLVAPDGKWIVTDTYPNKARFSNLYLYNVENNSIKKVGEFHQPLVYKKERRIDLHPKWSSDSKSVF
jgi:Tol biopolymer transport system component